MRYPTQRILWFAVLFSVVTGCPGACATPSAPQTPAEAVSVFLKAVKPVAHGDNGLSAPQLAALLRPLLPGLAAPSREALECFLAVVPEVQEHDRLARNTFGTALEKADGYGTAEDSLAMMMSFTTVLSAIPPGANAGVVRQVRTSATEVMFRLRWSKSEPRLTQVVEETVVAVQEGREWKVLLPLSGTINSAGQTKDGHEQEITCRKQEAWDAAAVRKSDQEALNTLKAFRATIARLTQDLKDGHFQNVEAYLAAVNADEAAP